MYVCAYANYATWTTFLKRTDISVCKYLYLVHRSTNIYNAKYIAPSAHMETCINYSQFRQVLVCNLSPITYNILHTCYFRLVPHLHPGTEQTPMYVCTGGAQAARRIRCRTHTPFPFRTLHIRTHALCYHPHLCNLLVLSNLPFFLPQQNRKRKKKRESRVLNYVPCHPARKYVILAYSWCHVTTMWQNICGEKNANRAPHHNYPILLQREQQNAARAASAEFFKKERFSFHPVHTTWYRWRQAHTIDTSDEEAECPLRMRY